MKRIILIIILLALIGGGYWWFTTQQPLAAQEQTAGPPPLIGSGSIEAETVLITAELGGRIIDILVEEGEEVTAGQRLIELDKAELWARQAELEAALETAITNLELVSAPPRSEAVAVAEAKLAQAETRRDGALLTWQSARRVVNNPRQLEIELSRAKSRVTEAEENLELARVALKRAEIEAEAASRDQSDHAGLVQYEVAQYQLQADQIGVQMAEVMLAGAKKQVEHLEGMRDNPLQWVAQANAAEAAYHQAEAAVLAAEANLQAVRSGATPEDIAIAEAQALETRAALKIVEAQLDKQTLAAPRDGLIGEKLVNPGELASPGLALLELNDIDTVELVVYIPEDRIGEVRLGQKARVWVDAYAGQTFEGVVSFIAHEAEFTPRNIQTQEERVNLVFAVEIRLDNPDHKLKPGMPADAEILSEMAEERPHPTPAPSSTVAPSPTATPSPSPTAALLPSPTAAASPTRSSLQLEAEEEAATPAVPVSEAEIMAWGLKVRSGPGVSYPVVGYLSQGDIVPVLDADPATGWLQIELPAAEETGWVTDNPDYVLLK